MATFQQVLDKAMQAGKFEVISVNQGLMQASMATKRSPASLKVGINDELAKGLMMGKKTAFIIHIDGDELNEIAKQIDSE
jgi:hypothetical protein